MFCVLRMGASFMPNTHSESSCGFVVLSIFFQFLEMLCIHKKLICLLAPVTLNETFRRKLNEMTRCMYSSVHIIACIASESILHFSWYFPSIASVWQCNGACVCVRVDHNSLKTDSCVHYNIPTECFTVCCCLYILDGQTKHIKMTRWFFDSYGQKVARAH